MKRVIGLVFFIAFMVTLVLGVQAINIPDFKEVLVDGARSGQTVTLSTGSMAVIELESNPSTGYRWELINHSRMKGVVREVFATPNGSKGVEYAIQKEKLPTPGAPRRQIIRLVGEKQGSTEITLAYRRPWEAGNKGIRRFNIVSEGKFSENFKSVVREKSTEKEGRANRPLTKITAPGLPSHWDWREHGVVTPVRDQGSCGSCWAFGSVAAFESKIMMKDKVTKDLSEQYIVSCNDDGWSCSGGWWAHEYHTFKALPQEPGAGARLESEFPYQAQDVACKSPNNAYEQLEGWAYTDDIQDSPAPTTVHIPTIAQLKQKILDYGPVGTDICSSTWGGYTGGIFTNHCSPNTHIVLITGWDDTEGVFYIKNSWGTGWGENGYMRIAYDVCNVGHNSTYLLYEKTNPRILYRTGLFHEDKANNGSISNPAELRIEDSTENTRFARSSGSFVQGTDYTVANLPSNLGIKIEALSNTTAQVTLTGSALNHMNSDDVNNMTISFLDVAFTGGNAALVENASYNALKINFFDPYQLVYQQVSPTWVNCNNTWQFYWLAGSDDKYSFGLWWYDNTYEPANNRKVLKLETYTKPALSLGTALPPDLRALNSGDLIGPGSDVWAAGGSYGDQHTLAGPAHNNFKGASRYVGFSFQYNGYPVYGWMQFEVTADGSSGALLAYAWQQDPNKTIRAGQTENDPATTPVASFTANPRTIAKGGSVAFTDQSRNAPTSWQWTFKGGTPGVSNEQNPSVIYNATGTYDVTLTVSNALGTDTMTQSGLISVIDQGLTADFTHVASGLTVTFTDTSITQTNPITAWQWDFGDSGSSSLQNPSHTYGGAGTYQVSLTATNDQGQSNTVTKTITVNTLPPQKYCTATHAYNYGYINSFSVSGINNTSGWGTNGYADFTDQVAQMQIGNTYPVEISAHNQHWSENSLGIWVDWNQDGDFDDTGERVYSFVGAGPYSDVITPPASALHGCTRMRVRLLWDRAIVPCGDDDYFGDVEDYTVNIQ